MSQFHMTNQPLRLRDGWVSKDLIGGENLHRLGLGKHAYK